MVQVACGIDIGGSGVKGALVDLETGEYIGDVMIVQAVEGNNWEYLDSASTN